MASAVRLIEFRSSLDCEESSRNFEESASNDACRASEVSLSVPSGPDLEGLAVMLGGTLVQGSTNCNHLPIVGDIYGRRTLLGWVKSNLWTALVQDIQVEDPKVIGVSAFSGVDHVKECLAFLHQMLAGSPDDLITGLHDSRNRYHCSHLFLSHRERGFPFRPSRLQS